MLATVEVAGDARPRALMDAIMKHPFLDAGRYFRKAQGMVISLIGGESLSMDEVREFVEHIKAAAPEAQLALGVHIDESLANCVGVTVMLPYPEHETIDARPKSEAANALQVNRVQTSANKGSLLSGAAGAGFAQQQLPLVSISKGRFDKGEPNLRDGKDLDVPTFLRRNIILT
jgi:cell division protein FtsZ